MTATETTVSVLLRKQKQLVLYFKIRNIRFCWSILFYSPTEIGRVQKQRWSPRGRPWPRGRPRGHILKSLASRPQVLENWPVLGSRTALFFELLKFCGALEKFFGKRFFVEIAWKFSFFFFFLKSPEKFLWRPFFWRALALVSLVLGLGLEHSCPWPRECLSSERLSLALASDFFCVLGLGLEPCVFDSTSVQKFWLQIQRVRLRICSKTCLWTNFKIRICSESKKSTHIFWTLTDKVH